MLLFVPCSFLLLIPLVSTQNPNIGIRVSSDALYGVQAFAQKQLNGLLLNLDIRPFSKTLGEGNNLIKWNVSSIRVDRFVSPMIKNSLRNDEAQIKVERGMIDVSGNVSSEMHFTVLGVPLTETRAGRFRAKLVEMQLLLHVGLKMEDGVPVVGISDCQSHFNIAEFEMLEDPMKDGRARAVALSLLNQNFVCTSLVESVLPTTNELLDNYMGELVYSLPRIGDLEPSISVEISDESRIMSNQFLFVGNCGIDGIDTDAQDDETDVDTGDVDLVEMMTNDVGSMAGVFITEAMVNKIFKVVFNSGVLKGTLTTANAGTKEGKDMLVLTEKCDKCMSQIFSKVPFNFVASNPVTGQARDLLAEIYLKLVAFPTVEFNHKSNKIELKPNIVLDDVGIRKKRTKIDYLKVATGRALVNVQKRLHDYLDDMDFGISWNQTLVNARLEANDGVLVLKSDIGPTL